jgi:hypothetical protein
MSNNIPSLKQLEPNNTFYIYVSGKFDGNTVVPQRTIICANAADKDPQKRDWPVTVKVSAYDIESHDRLVLLRGHSVDAAGALEDDLASCLVQYHRTSATEFKDLLDSKNPEIDGEITEDDIRRIDFMKKRNLLSNLLKKKLKTINSKDERKLLNNIILERNKYAHGVFVYLPESKEPMIRYRKSDDSIVCASVSEEHFNSFMKCYFHLQELLTEVKNTINSSAGS